MAVAAKCPTSPLPTTLASGLEQRIVDEVHRQVPVAFRVPKGTQGIAPKSPQESLDCMQTHDNLRIELVASEPLISDPVAIDFGFEGELWVAQMSDYGRGVYESFEHRGEVRRLIDSDSDGKFDQSQTFASGLRFPTDVKAWRDGVLICDAPDILFARDTDSDGKADDVKKLFSGFEVRNAQARVNSLRWGLDNWLHGSCGLFGGEILSHKTGQTTSLVGRDFRLNPDTGEIQSVSGRTQQGLARNDWGDWFGCSNGTLLRHYASNERYVSRNPYVSVASPGGLVGDAEAYRLYPPENLVQFELSGTPGKATSACGLGIYRDDALGTGYSNNAFTCEPVHQSVHRIVLQQDSLHYSVSRGEGESNSEFLSSTDRWFRPVQARTGPDGGLWVVDMYRFVIEHSRWIPQATLAELDVFAGQKMGRIYRVVAADTQVENVVGDSPTVPVLAATSAEESVLKLASSNGVVRDWAHQRLLWEPVSPPVIDALRKLAREAEYPASRIHAISVLHGLQALDDDTLLAALGDDNAEVTRHAIQLSEERCGETDEIRSTVLELATHANDRVRRQVAWSLGQIDHPINQCCVRKAVG